MIRAVIFFRLTRLAALLDLEDFMAKAAAKKTVKKPAAAKKTTKTAAKKPAAKKGKK
jgi:hypothetical protein